MLRSKKVFDDGKRAGTPGLLTDLKKLERNPRINHQQKVRLTMMVIAYTVHGLQHLSQ